MGFEAEFEVGEIGRVFQRGAGILQRDCGFVHLRLDLRAGFGKHGPAADEVARGTLGGLQRLAGLRQRAGGRPLRLAGGLLALGLGADIVADIRKSLEHPDQLSYFQLTPARKPTLKRKITQLRESGVTMLIGTDSGIPMKFQMLKHVVKRSSSLHDVAAYLTLMGRKYDTSSKKRPVAAL